MPTAETSASSTTMSNTQAKPNPGSDEALKQGCLCAVLDNNHGKWAPWPPSDTEPAGWWITAGCPLHGLDGEPW